MERYLTTAQVAERLGVSTVAVLRLRARGTLGGIWAGRTWFFRVEVVEALAESAAYQRRSRRVADRVS